MIDLYQLFFLRGSSVFFYLHSVSPIKCNGIRHGSDRQHAILRNTSSHDAARIGSSPEQDLCCAAARAAVNERAQRASKPVLERRSDFSKTSPKAIFTILGLFYITAFETWNYFTINLDVVQGFHGAFRRRRLQPWCSVAGFCRRTVGAVRLI